MSRVETEEGSGHLLVGRLWERTVKLFGDGDDDDDDDDDHHTS